MKSKTSLHKILNNENNNVLSSLKNYSKGLSKYKLKTYNTESRNNNSINTSFRADVPIRDISLSKKANIKNNIKSGNYTSNSIDNNNIYDTSNISNNSETNINKLDSNLNKSKIKRKLDINIEIEQEVLNKIESTLENIKSKASILKTASFNQISIDNNNIQSKNSSKNSSILKTILPGHQYYRMKNHNLAISLINKQHTSLPDIYNSKNQLNVKTNVSNNTNTISNSNNRKNNKLYNVLEELIKKLDVYDIKKNFILNSPDTKNKQSNYIKDSYDNKSQSRLSKTGEKSDRKSNIYNSSNSNITKFNYNSKISYEYTNNNSNNTNIQRLSTHNISDYDKYQNDLTIIKNNYNAKRKSLIAVVNDNSGTRNLNNNLENNNNCIASSNNDNLLTTNDLTIATGVVNSKNNNSLIYNRNNSMLVNKNNQFYFNLIKNPYTINDNSNSNNNNNNKIKLIKNYQIDVNLKKQDLIKKSTGNISNRSSIINTIEVNNNESDKQHIDNLNINRLVNHTNKMSSEKIISNLKVKFKLENTSENNKSNNNNNKERSSKASNNISKYLGEDKFNKEELDNIIKLHKDMNKIAENNIKKKSFIETNNKNEVNEKQISNYYYNNTSKLRPNANKINVKFSVEDSLKSNKITNNEIEDFLNIIQKSSEDAVEDINKQNNLLVEDKLEGKLERLNTKINKMNDKYNFLCVSLEQVNSRIFELNIDKEHNKEKFIKEKDLVENWDKYVNNYFSNMNTNNNANNINESKSHVLNNNNFNKNRNAVKKVLLLNNNESSKTNFISNNKTLGVNYNKDINQLKNNNNYNSISNKHKSNSNIINLGTINNNHITVNYIKESNIEYVKKILADVPNKQSEMLVSIETNVKKKYNHYSSLNQFFKKHLSYSLILKNSIKLDINKVEKIIAELKSEVSILKKELSSHYHSVLIEGKDTRAKGLTWVMLSVWKLRMEVYMSNIPSFLDNELVYHLFLVAHKEIELYRIDLLLKEIKQLLRNLRGKEVRKANYLKKLEFSKTDVR